MLQKNERLVLRYLIENARTTDSCIAEKIGISTQAVGKIRHKLEENGTIRGYMADIDPNKVGLDVTGLATLECNSAVSDEPSFRRKVESDPHITYCERVPYGGHFALQFAFTNIAESERYFKQLYKEYPDAFLPRCKISSWIPIWKDTKRGALLHALEHLDASGVKRD